MSVEFQDLFSKLSIFLFLRVPELVNPTEGLGRQRQSSANLNFLPKIYQGRLQPSLSRN